MLETCEETKGTYGNITCAAKMFGKLGRIKTVNEIQGIHLYSNELQ